MYVQKTLPIRLNLLSGKMDASKKLKGNVKIQIMMIQLKIMVI